MNKKITCKQVQAILPFYLKGRVNPAIAELIEEHLETCNKCKELYLKAYKENNCYNEVITLTPIVNSEEQYTTKEYKNFKKKLSAYLDSELEDSENIKIKKMTITNPLARKDLENMYNFKLLLHSSFARTKESCKYDFSKYVLKNINPEKVLQPINIMKFLSAIIAISTIISLGIYLKS